MYFHQDSRSWKRTLRKLCRKFARGLDKLIQRELLRAHRKELKKRRQKEREETQLAGEQGKGKAVSKRSSGVEKITIQDYKSATSSVEDDQQQDTENPSAPVHGR